MDVFGQLRKAQLENTNSDPTKRGEVVFHTGDSKAKVHDGTSARAIVTENGTATLTNKTFDADGSGNSIQNIENADIKVGANIARSKLASGTASHVVINDGSGVMSSEAQLAVTRGGTGQSTANAALNALLPTQTGNGDKVLATDGTNTAWEVRTRTEVVEFYYEDYFEVRLATTSAGTLATSFEDGDTVDGVVLATGDKILVKDQASASENGIYEVAASGAPTRHADYDSAAELARCSVHVLLGTTNSNTTWFQTNSSISAFADQLWHDDPNPEADGWFEWDVPANVSLVFVDVCGAGGGGAGGAGRGANGGSVAWSGGGGGGGQGGYVLTGKSLKVTPGNTLSVLLGKGGLGSLGTSGTTPNDGAAGGSTQIADDSGSGDFVGVPGGNGGNNGVAGDAGDTTGLGGVGGGTATDVNFDPKYGCIMGAPGGNGGEGIASATNNLNNTGGFSTAWANGGGATTSNGGGGGGGGGAAFAAGGGGGAQTSYGTIPTVVGSDGRNAPPAAGRMGGGSGGGGGAGAGATGTSAMSGTRGGTGGCGFVRISYVY